MIQRFKGDNMFYYTFMRLIFVILGTVFVFRGCKDFRKDIYFDNPNIYLFLPLLNWLIISYKSIVVGGRLEVTRLDIFWAWFLLISLMIPIAIIWYRNKRYFKLYIYNIEEEKIYDAIKYVLDKNNMPHRRKEGEIELSLVPVSIKGYYGNVVEPPYIKVFNHKAVPNFKDFVTNLKEHIQNEGNYYRSAKRSLIWIIYLACGIATLVLTAMF